MVKRRFASAVLCGSPVIIPSSLNRNDPYRNRPRFNRLPPVRRPLLSRLPSPTYCVWSRRISAFSCCPRFGDIAADKRILYEAGSGGCKRLCLDCPLKRKKSRNSGWQAVWQPSTFISNFVHPVPMTMPLSTGTSVPLV